MSTQPHLVPESFSEDNFLVNLRQIHIGKLLSRRTQLQTNKNQTKLLQFKNKHFLFIYSYPLSNQGAMARAAVLKYQGNMMM